MQSQSKFILIGFLATFGGTALADERGNGGGRDGRENHSISPFDRVRLASGVQFHFSDCDAPGGPIMDSTDPQFRTGPGGLEFLPSTELPLRSPGDQFAPDARYGIPEPIPADSRLPEANAPATPSPLLAPSTDSNIDDSFNIDDSDIDAFNANNAPAARVASRQDLPGALSDVAVNTMGDFFGEALRSVSIRETQSFAFHTDGFIVSGTPGSSSSLLVFERNGGIPDDFTTFGTGQDLGPTADGFADTFDIAEPLPPNEVDTSPGPDFTFDGGTVVYTGDTSTTQAIDGQYPAGSPNNTWYASYSFSRQSTLVTSGLALRRVKIAELNSPLPKHRIYGAFNFYNDVISGVGDVSQYFLGIERPFYQNLVSIDLRVPFASTLDSTQSTSRLGSRSAEFGNIVVTGKAVLWYDREWIFTGGLGLGLPTASDTKVVSGSTNQELLRIKNDSVHILPFLAGRWTPKSRLFLQWFLQCDVDAGGNDVRVRDGGSMVNIGKLSDQTLTFVDLTIGGWLRRCPGEALWGIVPVAELHYSTTSEDADQVSRGSFAVGSAANRYDVLNTTLGSHFMFRESTLTAGMSIPLRRSNFGDRQFDYEAIVQLERTF